MFSKNISLLSLSHFSITIKNTPVITVSKPKHKTEKLPDLDNNQLVYRSSLMYALNSFEFGRTYYLGRVFQKKKQPNSTYHLQFTDKFKNSQRLTGKPPTNKSHERLLILWFAYAIFMNIIVRSWHRMVTPTVTSSQYI